MVKPILYKQGMQIKLNPETGFKIHEDEMADVFSNSKDNIHSFYKAVSYLMNEGYTLKESKKRKEIMVYSPKVARFSEKFGIDLKQAEESLLNMNDRALENLMILSDKRTRMVKLLANTNEVPYDLANESYKSAGFDYEPTVLLIEQAKGYPKESREISEKSLERRLRLRDREDRIVLIEEWNDKELITANIHQSA